MLRKPKLSNNDPNCGAYVQWRKYRDAVVSYTSEVQLKWNRFFHEVRDPHVTPLIEQPPTTGAIRMSLQAKWQWCARSSGITADYLNCWLPLINELCLKSKVILYYDRPVRYFPYQQIVCLSTSTDCKKDHPNYPISDTSLFGSSFWIVYLLRLRRVDTPQSVNSARSSDVCSFPSASRWLDLAPSPQTGPRDHACRSGFANRYMILRKPCRTTYSS